MTDDTNPAVPQEVELDTMMLIIKSFLEHLEYTLGKDKYSATPFDIYNAVAYAVRDRLVELWLDTQQTYYLQGPKRFYYISMEFLMGRSLEDSLINLDIH
ncbi:MAG TPA: glycogen phosphorylase, partial [Geobacteraceae bacterium]